MFANSSRTINFLRTYIILFVPYTLFCVTLAILFLFHGGHHYAILSRNPYCTIPTSTDFQTAPRVFLQISDLHVNDKDGGKAKRNLGKFADHIVPTWSNVAEALIVTGDLVNACIKRPFPLDKKSVQLETEWAWLHSYASHVNRSVAWRAVYGNHDTFGGYIPHSHVNNFTGNLCSARDGGRVSRVVRYDHGGLSLLGLDCTLVQPLHRPFNFFGDARGAAPQLKSVLDEFNVDRGANHDVIAFGHYPSAVMAQGKQLHSLAMRPSLGGFDLRKPRFAAYLSGHLHTLAGLARRGLQVVAKSGAFELELGDMVESGFYRVLVFDNGFLSFRDSSVHENRDDPLGDIVITNPPRAGFCGAGAGAAASQSTFIRVVSSRTDLDKLGMKVTIDGSSIGNMRRISLECGAGKSACLNLFGAEWNASRYRFGVHSLKLETDNGFSHSHLFSLDGSQDPRLAARMERFISAAFALSDFDTMASALCRTGLLLCLLFVISGLRSKQTISLALSAAALFLSCGPILFTTNLTHNDEGWGWVSLWGIHLPSGTYPPGVDPPYILSTTVLWGSLVPLCYLDGISSKGVSSRLSSRKLLYIFVFFYLYGTLRWCFVILGAHGLAASVLSPSGFPLLIIGTISARTSLMKITRRRVA